MGKQLNKLNKLNITSQDTLAPYKFNANNKLHASGSIPNSPREGLEHIQEDQSTE